MKNTIRVFGIISIALIIGFSFSACDDDSGGGGLNGVWKTGDGEEITLNNGSFVISKDNKQFLKGKYTTSARSVAANITMEINEVHGDFLSEIDDAKTFENKWYDEKKVKETYSSLSDSQIAALLEILFKTETGTIDGDTMTIAGDTYTKQDGGSDSGGSGGSGGGSGNGGTFTLTDIPSQYNGTYADLIGDVGNIVFSNGERSLSVGKSLVSNGRVSIPLWAFERGSSSASRYSGNDAGCEIIVGLWTRETTGGENPATIIFSTDFDNAVTFSRGSTTRSWNEGEIYFSKK